MNNSQFGFKDGDLEKIITILKTNPDISQAIIFGSRAKGNYKNGSDVDIALKGNISFSDVSEISFTLNEDTLLPYEFDVLHYERLNNEELKQHIDRVGIVINEVELQTKWAEYKLGDVITSNMQSINKNYKYDTIKYLDTGSITEGKISGLQSFKISEAPSRAKRLVKENSIVYSTVRPIQRHYGFIKNPDTNLVVSTGFSVIETNPKLAVPLFIYYYLTSNEVIEILDSIADGSTSTYPSLKPQDIEQLDIFLPSLHEQQVIVNILSSLDNKIDLLQRQNKTLESIAQTLFQNCFVNNNDNGTVTKSLSEITSFNLTYKLPPGSIATYLEMANVSTSSYRAVTWHNRAVGSGTKFKNGDTLFARITPCLENGKTCFVDFLRNDEVGWGSTEYIVMTMKPPYHPFISYLIAKNNDFRDYAISAMTGSSGRQRAQPTDLSTFEVNIPPTHVVETLNYELEIFVAKLKNNSEQIDTLIKLRDLLLPKLIYGEVKVLTNAE